MVGTEIDSKQAGIGIRGHRRLYRIDIAPLLTQAHIQQAVHAGAAQQIVQQQQGAAARVVQVVGPGPDDDVRLVRIPVDGARESRHRVGQLAIHRCRGTDEPAQIALGQSLHPGKGGSPHRKEHHVAGGIMVGEELPGHRRRHAVERLGRTKNVATQRTPLEEQRLKLVVYQLGRGIEVEIDFIGHHLSLLVQLPLGELRVGHQVAQQLHGPGQMHARENRVDHRLLLGRVGIQLAPHHLHAVEDMRRTPVGRTLEQRMLHEMGQPVVGLLLVAGTGIDRKAAIRNGRLRGPVYEPQAVGQGANLIFFHK